MTLMDDLGNDRQSNLAAQGADDAGRYFHYMAAFVGFSAADADMIRRTKPIIERHLPTIVTAFYTHLLRYPPLRQLFLHKDGTIDEEYLKLRMRHLSNFWLRSAEGVYDDAYARYVDYVGRAHTSRGADPNIYIAERYVIGQVGMMQSAISDAVSRDLRAAGDESEYQAVEAWDKLMMVILELLARAYGHEREAEAYLEPVAVDKRRVADLAAIAIAEEHDLHPARPTRAVRIAAVDEIAKGERKIVHIDALSIGVFHHDGAWYAVRNWCVHRGGPVALGELAGDVLTCPWHGFQYDLRTGICLADTSAELDSYPVTVEDGAVFIHVPQAVVATTPPDPSPLQANAFLLSDLPSGSGMLVTVGSADVAVFNVNGSFYAIDDACTHEGGPLSEGELDGDTVICPWHGSCFNVKTGTATCGDATEPVQTYRVVIDNEIGRVELD